MSYCIYLRKSRADAEAELRGEGETLARHEKALTEFAKYNKLDVAAVYREIVSGETIAARPEMQRLLSEVSAGMWDGVIVMDIDRLARGNSIDQGIISQTFLFSSTKIITPTKTYDPENEFDQEYFEFGLFMSRREYKTINRRLQRGRTASVKEGKYVSNKSPYGYERIKLSGEKGYSLAVIPEQAQVIRNIFEWYTKGLTMPDGTVKQLGTSLIARELNSRGIKSPGGEVWTTQTIRDMLINPVYSGKIRWNWRPVKKKMIDGKVIQERPRNTEPLLFSGLHEPVISEEAFALAAARMKKNKSRPVRGDKKTSNPLASLVVCQLCGRKMQRRPNPSTADLLMCPEPTCHNHASFLYLVEERVIHSLEEWADGYKLNGSVQLLMPEKDHSAEAELDLLKKQITGIRAQMNRAFEAFETGIYDTETFQQRNSILKTRLAELEKLQSDIKASVKNSEAVKKAIKELVPAVRHLISAYDTLPDAAAKNSMLQSVIDHIEYIKTVRGHGHERDFEIILHPNLPKL